MSNATFQVPDRQFPDLALTALAPAIWGSTYIVATEFLPGMPAMLVALLRLLPAGLLLLFIVRQLPRGIWIWRVFVLGGLNLALFQSLLFFAAYRLPGGVAATVGAIQPLFVIFLASPVLGITIRPAAVLAALGGCVGVAALVLSPGGSLDTLGILAGLAGAVSMALGVVLTRRWQPNVSLLTFTAWQLTAGGLLLLIPVAMTVPNVPPIDLAGFGALLYLCLIGAALTYAIWFRGISRLAPNVVSMLGFLSPTTAVILGWLILNQSLSPLQVVAISVIFASIWSSQKLAR